MADRTVKAEGGTLQSKLMGGLVWMLLLNLLVKPFWILGIEVGVQNAVGSEEYGFYYAIFNLSYIFNILLDIGLTNFNTRNIARHPQLVAKHLPTIAATKSMLLLLYLVVTFSSGLLLGYESRQFRLLALLCFNQFLSSMLLCLRSNFEALLLFRWDSVLSILDRVLMILICGALLWLPGHPDFRIEYLVYAQTAAYLATSAIAAAVLRAKLRAKEGVEPSKLKNKNSKLKRATALVILRKSLPFALLVLLMASYNRLDPVLLQHLAADGNHEAGIYAGAFRLLDALTMIAYLVSVPLLPIYAKQTRNDHDGVRQTTRTVFSLMMVFAIAAAVTFAIMSDKLMTLLYDDNVAELSAVFCILIFGIIPLSATYVFGTLLTANGNLRQLNLLAAITLAINVAVNLVLIPRFGAVGSAWASLSAQTFIAMAQIAVAVRLFKIRVAPSFLLRMLVFLLAIVVLNIIAAPLSWWLHLTLAVVAAVALAIALRLLRPKELLLLSNE